MDTSPSRKENGRVFRCHRVLRHPPQRVFEAFAKPELLARGWGPHNDRVFLELKAPSAVVIHHVSPPRFVLTVSLATCADGTTIAWAQEFEDGAVADRIRRIAEPANEQNLNRLQAVLAGQEACCPTTGWAAE